MRKFNKGEWSELYAFAKLLSDGKIYAADENVNKIEDVYLPILKLIRQESETGEIDYIPGDTIRIFNNGILIEEFTKCDFENHVKNLCEKIFEGGSNEGAFEIPSTEDLMNKMHITKVKAASSEKIDLTMQIHDINTGYSPVVGFSVKSDVGSPPTLLNAGKNTRFIYEIEGCNDEIMMAFNGITKETSKEYIVDRMKYLNSQKVEVKYHHMDSEVFEDNLILIDSNLPAIYAELIWNSFKYSFDKIADIEVLTAITAFENKLNYRNSDVYRHKIKKLICASALGMTPGKKWDGYEQATGGYIIIKKDGDVLCYHLYNRNFFEEYLIKNTKTDRPSSSRHDYGYIYCLDGTYYIALNVQIRFKSISVSANSTKKSELLIQEYYQKLIQSKNN